MHLVKPQLLNQSQRVLILSLRFPGKAHDNIRAHGNIGNSVSNLADNVAVFGGSIRAAHPPQHIIVPGLDGQVDMLADLGLLRHRPDDAAAHIRRMRSEKTNPLQPVNIIQPGEQVGQILPVLPIVPVSVHRLPQYRHLAHPTGRQQFHFLGNISHRPADLSPPAVGNDAKSAHQVAAMNDGNISYHLRLPRRQRSHAALPV